MSATVPAAGPALPSAQTVMRQAADENFPVASWLFGRRYREDLLALYGYARLVDDTGDEAPGDRLALLDAIDAELAHLYAGGRPQHPVMQRLALTVRARGLPEEPLRRLIEANRVDQRVGRYDTFDELLGYCRLSAAPVGELVLHIFGAATPERVALSDRVCAALQVIEHLQDVAEDRARGRVYLPAAELERAGCTLAALSAPAAGPELRAVIASLADRCQDLLRAGVPLAGSLTARPRLAVSAFVAGGRSTLTALEQAGYDVLGQRPRRTRGGFARALLSTLGGR